MWTVNGQNPRALHTEVRLLFSSNRHANQQDLFICFKQSDGSWTEAHGLGEAINTQKGERFPYLSPDGKYLFFKRWVSPGNEDIMWVTAEIINDFKKILNPSK